jgi:Fic/DOC family
MTGEQTFGANRGRPSRERLFEQLATGIVELHERFGGLPSADEAAGIWGDIWYQEAHNSTAIEGNTLILKEVEQLLAQGRAVGNKPLAQYLEVKGYADASRWVYEQAHGSIYWEGDRLITVTEIRHVHRLAMAPVWEAAPHPHAGPDEAPGDFRRHDIMAFPGGMKPPEWTEVQHLVTDWADRTSADLAVTIPTHVVRRRTPATAGVVLPPGTFVNAGPWRNRRLLEQQGNIETLARAGRVSPATPADATFPVRLARAHAGFEQIHPFIDGNGRTGRLVTNLLLVRLGYPPAIIRKGDRQRYLNALQRADTGDVGPLSELLTRGVLDTLYRFVVPAVAGPTRLVPIISLADRELSAGTLRKAAMRGRLKAQRDRNGRWLSSRAWVDEYKASRSRRGRPANAEADVAGGASSGKAG